VMTIVRKMKRRQLSERIDEEGFASAESDQCLRQVWEYERFLSERYPECGHLVFREGPVMDKREWSLCGIVLLEQDFLTDQEDKSSLTHIWEVSFTDQGGGNASAVL
jgi:hypothetical protein